MKRLLQIATLLLAALPQSAYSIKFILTNANGTDNMDVALFKNRSQFDLLMKIFDVSSDAANMGGKWLQKYSSLGAAIATGAVEATQVGAISVLTAGAGAPAAIQAAASTSGPAFLATEAALKGAGFALQKYSSSALRNVIKKLAAEYFEGVKATGNNTVCKGIGSLKRDRHVFSDLHSFKIPVINKQVTTPISKHEYISEKDPKSVYCVIFNKKTINQPPLNAIRYQIIYAGELKPDKNPRTGKYLPSGGPFASYAISTYFTEVTLTNQNNEPIKDENGREVKRYVLTASLKQINPRGGVSCK